MEMYLPSGESYIRKAIRFSMSSPYNYKGSKSPQEIVDIFKQASDFGLNLLVGSASFNKVLVEHGELDDEQDKLIILDYLVIDFVKATHGMASNTFKAAISSFDLLEDSEMQKQLEKIVQSFVKGSKQ